MGKARRDFSLRRPTHSQERMRKKKSACFVRNDGVGMRIDASGVVAGAEKDGALKGRGYD